PAIVRILMSAAALFDELSTTDIQLLREALTGDMADELPLADGSQPDRIAVLQSVLGDTLCRKLGIFRLPADFKLSVVMPVYNEIRTLPQVIERIRATRLPIELVIVDDGSRDGSREYLADLQARGQAERWGLKIIFQK